MADEFEVVRDAYQDAIKAAMPQARESLTAPDQVRKPVRDESLREVLRHAVEHSPWHRTRLDGIDFDAIDGDDLTALPTMTKTDLMANWDEIVTDSALSLSTAQRYLDSLTAGGPFDFVGGYVVVATGGSTGLRGVIASDASTAAANASAVRMMTATDPLAGAQSDLDAVPTVARLAADNPMHISRVIAAILGGMVGDFITVGPDLPVEEGVARLNAAQPDVVNAYPTLLSVYAHEAFAGRLHIAPSRVMSVAEPLDDNTRSLVGDLWDVGVSDMWSASEGFVAMSWAGSRQLHQPDTVAIIEPVDEDNQPVPPGTTSAKILLTHLHNKIQPLIRYEITDQVRAAEAPEGCPWTGPWFEPPAARLDDRFVYESAGSDIVVHPHVFRSALLAEPGIAQYQVRQTTNGAHVLVLAPGPIDTTALHARIRSDLETLGLPHADVTIEPVEHIDRHPQSGKLRRFIPLKPNT